MRIRIDIDITPNELTAWLESIVAAPPPAKPLPESSADEFGDDEDWDYGFDQPDSKAWLDSKRAAAAVIGDTDWDFPDFDPEAEDTLAAESTAIAAATRWMASRIKGGGHA